MKFSTYSFKQLLSGGLLCCLILLAAYIFQAFFPGMYVDAFSSSMHLLMWLTLFVGALLWTFHEKGETFGISEVIDWQFIAAFILITADEIYMIMPREIHMEIAPVLSEYTIPVLAVIGIMVAATIKVSITLYHKLADERRQEILSIFCITDGTYRTMRSRARKRLGLDDKDLDIFLQKELK